MSEIDDIFSGQSAPKTKIKVPDAKPAPQSKKKKKKSKKAAPGVETKVDLLPVSTEEIPAPVAATGAKRKVPETVVDPSLETGGKTKKVKVSKKEKKGTVVDSDDERFRDSRGTGPRRKTEEGFAIYKEDELGINDEGGDTPLCPFDCDCCF